MTNTHTFQVATTSLRDIGRILDTLGVELIEEYVTPGACGYTTLTVKAIR